MYQKSYYCNRFSLSILYLKFFFTFKLDKINHNVYTLLGDGELSEGSVWEALLSANKYGLDNLVVIIDRNKLQITGKTEDVNPIEPLMDKFNSFGLSTKEVDGNSVQQLNEILSSTPFEKKKVSLIIANTVKGKGIRSMENNPEWHHKIPSIEELKNDNGILYGNAAGALQVTAEANMGAPGTGSDVSTSFQVLTVTAAGVPVWTDTIDGGTF